MNHGEQILRGCTKVVKKWLSFFLKICWNWKLSQAFWSWHLKHLEWKKLDSEVSSHSFQPTELDWSQHLYSKRSPAPFSLNCKSFEAFQNWIIDLWSEFRQGYLKNVFCVFSKFFLPFIKKFFHSSHSEMIQVYLHISVHFRSDFLVWCSSIRISLIVFLKN